MGKTLKGRNVEKESAKERMENILHDSAAKMVYAKKSIFPHFQKHETGSPISSIMIGMI